MKAYLLDIGVLLTPEEEEFDCYNSPYNKAFGFYDEGQEYFQSKEAAIEEAKEYVLSGVEHTYAIVSETYLPDDFDFEEGYVEDETYKMEDVVYSLAKFNGEEVEDFLKRDREDLLKPTPLTQQI